MNIWKAWLIMIVVCISIGVMTKALEVYDRTVIDVGVIQGYHSYTKAFSQRQDYYIECDGTQLLNITPVDYPMVIESIVPEELCR